MQVKSVFVATILLAIGLYAATATTTFAIPRSNRVRVKYVPPKDPSHQEIYETLKERRSLERMQSFLSPFRLPRMLTLSVQGCNGEADAFYDKNVITICYEYIAELWKNMPDKRTEGGVEPIDAVVGPLVDTILHEFAHALFDMFLVPLLGREEDAADQVAAFINLYFAKAEARRLISGTIYAYASEARRLNPLPLERFSDEHGTPAQRAYNLLCIAYGSDPKLFGDYVSKGYLPKERAEVCDGEYEQIQEAFEKLILPYVDRAMAKKFMGGFWLKKKTKRGL